MSPAASSRPAAANTCCASPAAIRPKRLGDLILAWRDGRPVRLGDVATVEVKRPEQRFFAYQNGNPAIGLRILRESGANVLDTLDEVKRVVAEVREKELQAAAASTSRRVSTLGSSSTARSACCRATCSPACCWRWAACGGSCATCAPPR